MAILVSVDDVPREVLPARKTFTLEELQTLVEGWIERVGLPEGPLYCNEEGRINGMPLNERASRMFGIRLHGPVVLLRHDEEAR